MPLSKQRESELRIALLRELESKPDVSQRELAARLGVSLGGVNYCMRALVNKGWVKLGNFAKSDKKTRYVYKLTPSGLAEKARLTSEYLEIKMAEYECLKQEIEALRAELDR